MICTAWCTLFCIILGAVLLAACTFKTPKQEELPEALKSILILPVQAAPEKGQTVNAQFERGIMAMNRALITYFEKRENFKLLTELDEQFQEMPSGNRLTLLRSIAARHNSDGVLLCNLNRYIERKGKDYAIESPASVAFDCKVIEVEQGRALCFFTFDETQQPLSENLLSLPDARRRGFKWLTAEQLLKDGLYKKFSPCPMLKKQ